MRLITIILALMLLTGAFIVPASAGVPYWDTGARDDSEQTQRIEKLRDERASRKDRLARVRGRLKVLEARERSLKRGIRKHDRLLTFIKIALPWTTWLYSTRVCESSDNYQAVSASGSFRGAYQFTLSSWAKAYGYYDPIDAPWFVQDARASEVREARGTGPWPHCG